MDHHLIREEHQRDFCPYCRNKMNGDRWESEWHNDTHYKSITCRKCDTRIWMRVSFAGDGNDNWDGEGTMIRGTTDTLELKLKEAEPRLKQA